MISRVILLTFVCQLFAHDLIPSREYLRKARALTSTKTPFQLHLQSPSLATSIHGSSDGDPITFQDADHRPTADPFCQELNQHLNHELSAHKTVSKDREFAFQLAELTRAVQFAMEDDANKHAISFNSVAYPLYLYLRERPLSEMAGSKNLNKLQALMEYFYRTKVTRSELQTFHANLLRAGFRAQAVAEFLERSDPTPEPTFQPEYTDPEASEISVPSGTGELPTIMDLMGLVILENIEKYAHDDILKQAKVHYKYKTICLQREVLKAVRRRTPLADLEKFEEKMTRKLLAADGRRKFADGKIRACLTPKQAVYLQHHRRSFGSYMAALDRLIRMQASRIRGAWLAQYKQFSYLCVPQGTDVVLSVVKDVSFEYAISLDPRNRFKVDFSLSSASGARLSEVKMVQNDPVPTNTTDNEVHTVDGSVSGADAAAHDMLDSLIHDALERLEKKRRFRASSLGGFLSLDSRFFV